MTVLEVSPLTLANGPAEFARCIFTPLPRSDQRRWAEVYLQGLLTVPGKKTIKKMIRVAGNKDVSRMTQSLQQFISQSTWDWYQVREAMARKLHASLDAQAWVVDQAVVPKRGTHSVGVAKRFIAAQGRTFNCQVGIGLFLAASDVGSLPVDWSLALDDTWSLNEERRSRAKIPGDVAGKPDSELILDMVDRAVHDWGLPPLPVVAGLCNCPDAYSLLAGLQERNTGLVLEIPASLEVLPAFPAGVKPTVEAAIVDGVRMPTARELASASTSRPHVTSVPHGTEAQRVFLRSCLVRVPGLRTRPHLARATFRLYAEWSPTESQATRFWITNLLDRRPDEIMKLAAMRHESATDLARMEKSFGVKDFEGRSFPGWHRHMTLASAAYAFDKLKAAGRLMVCAPSL